MNLALAERMAYNPTNVRDLEFCELADRNGVRIHHTDILEFRSNDWFWVDESGDEIL